MNPSTPFAGITPDTNPKLLGNTPIVPAAPITPPKPTPVANPVVPTKPQTPVTPTPDKPIIPNPQTSSAGHSPVYDANNNIVGYNTPTGFQSALPQQNSNSSTSTNTPAGTSTINGAYTFTSNGDGTYNLKNTSTGQDLGKVNSTDEENAVSVEQTQKASEYFDKITGYENGSIPLTASEQAQVDDLKRQYQTLTDNQKLINTNASGTSLGRGFATGAAEYGNNFVTNIQNTVLDKGVQAIADLNSKMSSAVAALEQSFRTNDMNAAKEAYAAYTTAATDRINELEKQKTAVADALKAQNALIEQQKTDQYNQVQKPINDIATEAAKNGADTKTLASINKSKSVTDAISAAGSSLQTATGQLGDYLQYKRDSEANGVIPHDYVTWKSADDKRQSDLKVNEAYGTAFATAKGKAAGEASAGGNTPTSPVTSQSGIVYNAPASIAPYVGFASNGVKYVDLSNFAGTPTEKNAAVNDAQKAGYRVITNKNSASDVQNIQDALGKLQLMKDAFDPLTADSAAARNTYKAALNNLQSFAQTNPDAAAIGVFQDSALDILKAMSGTQGFRGGSSILEAVKSTFPSISDTKATADKKIANIEALIKTRETALVGKPNSTDQALIDSKNAKSTIDGYVKSNPAQASVISQLYSVPGVTDLDILNALKARNLIQ